ncbi:MAG: DUF1206 domain-containing protein [Actinomycetota bacterium]|nr:DUF1206 domain-containing protein [Actinomycetota bacterium]
MEASQVRHQGARAQNSEWLDVAIRIGLVAYGIVHLTIAWLAAELALGNRGGGASQQGALHHLAGEPFGKILVWAIALGMFLLVIWQLLEAALGHRGDEGGERIRKRATSTLKAVFYGYLGVLAVKTVTGGSSGGGARSSTAKAMAVPGGAFVVGLVGVAVIGYGAGLAWWGWKEKFAEHLDSAGRTGEVGKAYLLLGKVGYIAKGLAMAVVGGLFCYAALTHDPNKAGGLDAALHEVLQQTLGVLLLLAIAVGLACYGLFCFARARHLNS